MKDFGKKSVGDKIWSFQVRKTKLIYNCNIKKLSIFYIDANGGGGFTKDIEEDARRGKAKIKTKREKKACVIQH